MIGRGISANDPFWDAPKLELPKSFSSQARRCACRHRLVPGVVFDGAACVLNPDSDCFRSGARPATDLDLGPGRGWIAVDRPGCSRDPDSFCAKRTAALPRLATVKSTASWDWRTEVDTYCTAAECVGNGTPHFASDDITYIEPPKGEPRVPRLTHEYAVWTLVDLENHLGVSDHRPGASIDPEYDSRGTELLDTTTQESIRIRSSFFEKPVSRRTGQHTAFYIGLDCALNTLEEKLTRIHLWFGPDPVSPATSGFGDLRLVAHDGSALGNVALVRPADENASQIAFTLGGAAGWLTDEAVHVVPLARRAGVIFPGPSLSAASADDFGDPAAEPDLLAVERSEGQPRWARLSAVHVEPTVVHYTVVAEGALRGSLSPEALLVADSAGSTAAIIDFANGVAESYAPEFGRWARLPLPQPLIGRTDVAVALWGPNLLMAGGALNDSVKGDLWQIDLQGAGTSLLREDLPARRQAQLQVAPSGQSVLLVGGIDPLNLRHDDAWQLSLAGLPPREFVPVRKFADTSRAADFDPRTTALVADPYGSDLTAVTFDPVSPTKSATLVRTHTGWQPAAPNGEPLACAASDATGGELCAIGSEWWGGPGRRPCNAATNTCEGSGGALLGSATIPGLKPVDAADIDAASVWIARGKSLERWAVDADLKPSLADSVQLTSKPRDVRAQGGNALVATKNGVQLARGGPNGFEVSPTVPLCGRALHIEPAGDNVWAVATSVGLALLGDSGDGNLSLLSMSLLLPFAPQHHELLPLEIEPSSIQACINATAWLPTWVENAIANVTQLAAARPGQLLMASGPRLFLLDIMDPAVPAVTLRAGVPHPVRALRFDALGQRAYGQHHGTHKSFIADLRNGALSVTAGHTVPDWVERREAGDLALRVTKWRRAELARVAR